MLQLCRITPSPNILSGRLYKQTVQLDGGAGVEDVVVLGKTSLRAHRAAGMHLDHGLGLHQPYKKVCISLMEDKWPWGDLRPSSQFLSVLFLLPLNSWGLRVGMVTMVTFISPWRILDRGPS